MIDSMYKMTDFQCRMLSFLIFFHQASKCNTDNWATLKCIEVPTEKF